jgi:hypothetical protein
MSSVLYANSIALILVLLAWYSLSDLRSDLNAAISEERVDRAIASRERKLAKQERTEHRRQLDDRKKWMSAANELLIETSSKSWTTQDQLEYERLREKLNPNLVTPDYRKPPSQRKFPVTPSQFRIPTD